MENQNKINLIKQMIEAAESNINQARELLAQIEGKDDDINESGGIESGGISEIRKPTFFSIPRIGKIIEGFFNGESMISSEGKEYLVPVNYASKSKLVEGDILKLTIASDGSFIYKQIGPVSRKRLVGRLVQDTSGQYFVLAKGRSYKVLLASVTYFKAKSGDEVTILVPQKKEAQWAAIENLVSALNKSDYDFSADSMEQQDRATKEEELNKKDAENFENNEDPAKLIKDEWTPDLDEIKKEASDIFSEESKKEQDL